MSCQVTQTFDDGIRTVIYCFAEHWMSRDMTKPTRWLCAQRRLRSAWASAQSGQCLSCALNGSWGPKLFSCGQRILWSHWADAKADLSIRWAHTQIVGFVMSWFKLLINLCLPVRFLFSSVLNHILFWVIAYGKGRNRNEFQFYKYWAILARALTKATTWPVRPTKTQISLASGSVGRQESNASSCVQPKVWSDCTYAVTDQSLRWAHVPFCRFYCFPAHFFIHLWRVCLTSSLLNVFCEMHEKWRASNIIMTPSLWYKFWLRGVGRGLGDCAGCNCQYCQRLATKMR